MKGEEILTHFYANKIFNNIYGQVFVDISIPIPELVQLQLYSSGKAFKISFNLQFYWIIK